MDNGQAIAVQETENGAALESRGPRLDAVRKPRKVRSVPRVTVYSRHGEGCKYAGKGREKETGCGCPKWVRYYRNGQLVRKSAETCDLEKAEALARDLENGFEAAATGKPQPVKTTGKLLADAIEDYKTSKRQNGLTEKHINSKLGVALRSLADFMHARGLVNLGDIHTEDVQAWRNQLEGHQNTRAKRVYTVIGFFEYCVELGWINRNVARARAVVIPYADEQRPRALNDSQYAQLLAAVPKVNGRTTASQKAMLRSLVTLMRWTGLAIKDACLIERARFTKNGHGFFKLELQRAKTGHPVFCTLRPEIVEQIFAGARAEGRYLFVESVPTGERELETLVKTFGDLMRKLGEAADLKDENGQPYRFTSHGLRHTFVLWCLNNGMPTEDVAALIGDSVQIVAKHYSEWISARQEKLNERMMQMLAK